WTGEAPSYLQYTGLMWDASWYRTIAENDYPAILPVSAEGVVQQNAWAFFPLFPLLVRGVMTVTTAPWYVAAPLTALVLGAIAMLVVHQVIALVIARPAAARLSPQVRRALPLTTVAVLTTSAASPLLQVGYTESLALLLVAAVVWALLRERHGLAVPLILALGLTRAVAAPVAVVVVAHAWWRWNEARDGRPWPVTERWAAVGLAALALASGLLWPAICGWVTGVPDAYTQTQGAWRGRGEVVPLVPWLDVARWLFGGWATVVLVAAAVLAVLTVTCAPMRRLGPELTGWTGGYLAYLVVVVEPGTSLVRFLLLAFPVAGVVAQLALRSRFPRAAITVVLCLGLVAQVAWIALLWRLVPPSGWPP
ncbi:MAG: hypothetical protein HGA44_21630, partial [Cellulomonadaceae bacterium]|nr:hypothetical protein [Cellulomonadaceae bacterium]